MPFRTRGRRPVMRSCLSLRHLSRGVNADPADPVTARSHRSFFGILCRSG
jgi:hypothetical protein